MKKSEKKVKEPKAPKEKKVKEKKAKAPKEPKAPKNNRQLKRERDRRIANGISVPDVSSTKAKALLCIAIAGIALFCGTTIGLTGNISISGPEELDFLGFADILYSQKAVPVAAEPQTTVQAATAPAAPVVDTTAPADNTTVPVADTTAPADNTDTPAQDTTAAPTSAGTLSASSSTEEIVAYYNSSANKIKTSATKIVRNYEDLKSENEYLVVPDAVKAIGEFAMNTFLKRSDVPVEYATPEDIKNNYPVRTQDYTSQLTADQLTGATVVDNGDTYEITLSFATDEANINPTFGVGYGKAFNIVLEEEIVLDYPGLSISNVKLKYHDGVIKCTVDKATGNITEATYTMPMILSLTAKILFSEVDAQIGMCFEHNYTLTY